MNIIAIKGRLVRDPEIRQTQSGVSVTNITVAVDRSYSAGGEKQTDFFDCVFWRQGAEFVSKYFKKGKEIIVTGEMQSRKWQDKEGNNRLVLLELSPEKENAEIVHWHYIDDKGLEKIKRQAEREDGQLLILPSDKEEVGALSNLTNVCCKDTTFSGIPTH